MRKTGFGVLIVAAIATVAPTAGQQRDMGGVGIMVFIDANYRGRNATFRDDVPSLSRYGLDNRISSLQVAPGETWEVCEDPNYRGRCQVFSGNESNLQLRGWNDAISSMRRIDGDRPGNLPTWPPYPPSGSYGIELFAERDYWGDRREITGEVTDLRSLDFNDRAQSLRLQGPQNWEVCTDNYFRNCVIVDTDWPDLRRLGKNRSISSLRPWSQGGGAWPPASGQGRLVLYDDPGFRGRSTTITSVEADIFDMAGAESARVTGSWQLCEGPEFTGRCVVVTADVSDLRNVGVRRVISARPSPRPR